MYKEFKQLPDDARVWIYQCNRSFTEDEQAQLRTQLEDFISHWMVHGKELLSSFELRYNRFIVIGASPDAHGVGGCSLDVLARFIQDLEAQYNVTLLDRMNVSYRQGEHIAYKNLADFKKMVKDKAVSAQTIVFNNLVNTKIEYEMNNSATTRRISKIALQYNGNDKGTAEMVYSNNLLSDTAENQFQEMKAVADRNKNVKNWALTGYISPERSDENEISNDVLVELTLKALEKVGVTKDNQIRLDIHNSTKHKHIHFVVNRVNTHGQNTITAHKIGELFGQAVREICKNMNLKTDVEISKEKKEKMLDSLHHCLKKATNFDELITEMEQLGYKVILSENVKVGISGMRIVKISDINTETKREYPAGYKLSEITNKLKIKEIKEILEKNNSNLINEKEEINRPYKRKF